MSNIIDNFVNEFGFELFDGMIAENITPLIRKYEGMGYYNVICYYKDNRDKYLLINIGGPSSVDIFINEQKNAKIDEKSLMSYDELYNVISNKKYPNIISTINTDTGLFLICN